MKTLKSFSFFFAVLFCLVVIAPTKAQIHLQTFTDVQHCQFILSNNQLNLDCPGENSAKKALKIVDLRLVNGNLLLEFSLEKPVKEDYYELQLTAKSAYDTIVAPPLNLRGIQTINEENWDRSNQLTWQYFLDRFIPAEYDEIDITLEARRYGHPPIDCDLPAPSFRSKERLPYYLVGGAGIALTGTGLILKKQSNDEYEEYKKLYIEGDKQDAENIYRQANEKHHNSNALIGAGIAIVVIDAAIYTYRTIRHKKKMQWYNEYCREEGLTLKPWYEFNMGYSHTSALGLKLSLIF